MPHAPRHLLHAQHTPLQSQRVLTHRPQPDLSIILVSYNTQELIDRLIAALETSRDELCIETIIVDNASHDGSAALLRARCPSATIIENGHNVGFGRANNQGMDIARGRYVLLLNTDAFVAPDTLAATVRAMDAHPDWGILGVRLTGVDGSDQPSCRYFPTPWNMFLNATGLDRFVTWSQLVDDPACARDQVQECDWVPGCFFLIRCNVIAQIGTFDPRFFMYYEEVDYCRRAKAAGWKVAYFPHTRVIHLGGASAEALGPLVATTRQISALHMESEVLYLRKYHGVGGLLSMFAFTFTAHAIVALKALLKRGRWLSPPADLRSGAALLSALAHTQGGLRPTR